MTKAEPIHHYFVDEAGDLSFFDKQGRIIVGNDGVSLTFMVGVALIPDPAFTDELLRELRNEIIADPYFKGVPSISAAAGKTARYFHASKDPAEVRRDVFARLPQCKAKVFVAFRRKHVLAEEARRKFDRAGVKVTLRSLYDDLVSRLFRDMLHKAELNRVVFAKHAKWGRREALALAIKKAKANFAARYGIESNKPTDIQSAEPDQHGGLQVIDYHLWAIQRMVERREDRFFELLRPAYRVIMDLDDKRNKEYGEWYSDQNPLTLAKILPPAS